MISSGQLRTQLVETWKAFIHGEDLPPLPKEDDNFNRNVSFFEATTESIAQFTIGDIIIRTYGISDDLTTRFFQLFSLASSMFSLTISFIMVHDY